MMIPSDLYNSNERAERLAYNNSDDEVGETASNNDEVALVTVPKSIKDLKHKDWWIADSGAITHLTCNPDSMVNVNDNTNCSVVMGNGSISKSCKKGDIKGLLVYIK